ncbi:hypothetical protein QJQ45_025822 [Haematococcus lacustris]|nr:hypothetical protein QJQ45_025822 [Haematococcus lacustris]
MGGACCKPPPEWNPDGTQKPIQTADEEKNDGRDLRKAAKELDLESMDKLVKRMPRDQIGSNASNKEVSPEEGGYTALHYVTAANFLKGAKKLVLYGHALNTGNDEGRTPLHVAIEAGKRKVTGFLLSKGADINAKDKQGETPLMTAMLAGDKGLTLWLLGWTPESTFVAAGAARPGQQEASLSPDLGTSGTPAAKPVTKGSLDIDFSVLSKKGLGLCVIAARQGWWDVLQELIGWLPEDPSDPKLASTVLNTRSSDGETALGWVLKYAAGNAIRADLASSLVSLLLGRGASATVPAFKESVPPAALAAASGYTELYQQVLEAAGGEGAVQGIKDGLGRTLMHYAAAKGQLELVQQLLAKGLSAVTPDANKDTPLHLAALRGHATTAKELLAATISNLAGMPAGPNQVTLAMALTMPNSSGKVGQLLAPVAMHHVRPSMGHPFLSVLHLAVCASMLPKAQQAALAVVNAVAESDPSKLNVETADLIKDTPLLLAARHHQHAVVKALLAAGCPVNQTNAVGETALTCCLASVTRDTVALDAAILRLLLEAGADAEPAPPPPPPPGAPKGPPLKKAPLPMQAICMNDCNEFAELALNELGPRLPGGKPAWTKADDMGRLPLHLAALYNNAYIVKHLLVDAKVDVDQPCHNGRTALMYAAMNGSVDSAILLLNRKAKVSLKDKEGQAALAYCLKLDKPETLQTAALLLRKGAAASNTALDVAGEGLLHRAVR